MSRSPSESSNVPVANSAPKAPNDVERLLDSADGVPREHPVSPDNEASEKAVAVPDRAQQPSVPEVGDPWWLSFPGEERGLPLAGGERGERKSSGELPKAPLHEQREVPRRFNSEWLQSMRRANGGNVTAPPPESQGSLLVVENNDRIPVSASAIETRQSQAPNQPSGHAGQLIGVELKRSMGSTGAEMELPRLTRASAELNMEMSNSRVDAPQQQCDLRETLGPRNSAFGLLSTTSSDLDLTTAEETEGHTRQEVRKDGGDSKENGDAVPWATTFRIISGNTRKKTKPRTLVAPRCHDAYGQLATASTPLV